MFTQLFAVAFCIVAVGLALMLQQLPEHKKAAAGIESTQTTATGVAQPSDNEPVARPHWRHHPCDGLNRKSWRACQRYFGSGMDGDQPQEEPELD